MLLTSLLFGALALPALAVGPEELVHLRYLADTNREEEATARALTLLQQEPEELSLHLLWMHLNRFGGAQALSAQEQIYEGWLASLPGDPTRRMELAVARGMARAEGGRALPERPGAWCDEVLGLLDPLPEAPELRAKLLWERQVVLYRCRRDDSAERAELLAMAETVESARAPALSYRLDDDVIDEADADALALLLSTQPWRIKTIRSPWAKAMSGDGLERARALMTETADKLAAREEPALVDAALSVYLAADLDDRAEATLARLRELDPKRPWFPSVRRGDKAGAAPEPLRLEDPAARLATLGETEPAGKGYEALSWNRERGALLLQLGRDKEALHALRRAYVLDPWISANLRYSEEAARQGRELRSALRSINIAVDFIERGPVDPRSGPEAMERQRELLAEALRIRALVQRARGREDAAVADARRSLLIHESPEAHLVLGLAEDSEDPAALRTAFWHLSVGLADVDPQSALRPSAMARLEALWPAQQIWHPMGLVGWLGLDLEPPAVAEATGREDFPDLEITMDGALTRLSEIPGPLVVDLWATWCGPCRASLPNLDAVARQNPGVSVVAVSVDEELELAAAFLSASQPAFRSAWAGPDAMEALGVHGIPATFLLDADHRLVDAFHGWGTGDTRLNDAVQALLAEAKP